MKKLIVFIFSLFAILSFNGCSNGIDHRDGGYPLYYSNYDNNDLITLFLVDERGHSYGGIPYKCDSMHEWSRTAPNGEFTFGRYDTCEFDFYGLDGVYGDEFDDIVRIVDYRDYGKEGIPYECELFGVSSTYSDGSFIYDQDDRCTFYL